MSRSGLQLRVMLGVAAFSAVLLTSACSDAAGPSNDENSAAAAPRTEAPSASPTAGAPEIARQLAQGSQAETTSEGVGPSFSYTSATLPNLKGCFKYPSGAAYKSQPVYIQKWTGTAWELVRLSSGAYRSRKTDINGCVQFDDVPANMYLRLEAYTFLPFPACQMWDGVSKYIGPTAKNDVVWNVGTTYVSLYSQGVPNYSVGVCLGM